MGLKIEFSSLVSRHEKCPGKGNVKGGSKREGVCVDEEWNGGEAGKGVHTYIDRVDVCKVILQVVGMES